jgi:hypothetical protein
MSTSWEASLSQIHSYLPFHHSTISPRMVNSREHVVPSGTRGTCSQRASSLRRSSSDKLEPSSYPPSDLASRGWLLYVSLLPLIGLFRRFASQFLIYSWEFLITLGFEWDVIRGRRPHRWTIWVCSHSLFIRSVLRHASCQQSDLLLC